MSESRAVVVGGGIAGMAAAAALLRAGWEVTVLEQADAFGEVGAGLAVSANGLAAASWIGASDAIEASGHRIRPLGARDHRGRWIMRAHGPDDASNMLWLNGIHRQRLHGALTLAASGATLMTSCRVTGVDPSSVEGPRALVRYRIDSGPRSLAAEAEVEADLVVAADGIASTVRRETFGHDGVAYSGFTCWRAVVDDADLIGDDFTIYWGPGAEFGAVRISPTEVYWYGFPQAPAGAQVTDELAAAQAYTEAWCDPMRAIVRATRPEQLIRHDVHHLAEPLPSFVRGRVVLTGDAAHAMIPTMGQGANTSMEDGVTLGALLRAAGDVQPAPSTRRPPATGRLSPATLNSVLGQYDTTRRSRTQSIAARSVMLMRLGAGTTHPWASAVRRLVLGSVPPHVGTRGAGSMLTWTPPRP